MISKAERYDIKGRKYVGAKLKYYFSDVGLRNARLNFRQQEPTHIMENIIYDELLVRGYNVDVGIVNVLQRIIFCLMQKAWGDLVNIPSDVLQPYPARRGYLDILSFTGRGCFFYLSLSRILLIRKSTNGVLDCSSE